MHLPKQAILFLAACLASCGRDSPSHVAISLRGAGSTFDAPFFARAIPLYELSHKDVQVAYDAVGSGEGAKRFIAGDVDFGASDVPLGSQDLMGLKGGANSGLQFPVALGAVALVYNVPGSPPHLRLTGASIAGIYSGTISRWDDKAVTAANPGATLPHIPIIAIHRSDSSGSTYIFTDYLSFASTRWKEAFGRAKLIAWPGSKTLGVKGALAVGVRVKHAVGAIGYVELSNARSNHLATAAVENASGLFAIPTPATVRSAAAELRHPLPENFSLVEAKGGAYPISGYSWAIISKAEPNPQRQQALCSLFYWMVTDGQKIAVPLGYAELPIHATTEQLDDLLTCSNSAKSP